MYVTVVLESHLKQKICSRHKAIHFIFLFETNAKLFFEKIRELVCPTTCGLQMDCN